MVRGAWVSLMHRVIASLGKIGTVSRPGHRVAGPGSRGALGPVGPPGLRAGGPPVLGAGGPPGPWRVGQQREGPGGRFEACIFLKIVVDSIINF